MSFEADLKAHLNASTTLAALVGARMYPLVREQGSSLPAVTYQRIAGTPQSSLGGFTNGTSVIRVQIDCWALTYTDAIAMAKAVRDRMYVDAATFKSVMLLDQDFYEEETKVYRVLLDFNCTFFE